MYLRNQSTEQYLNPILQLEILKNTEYSNKFLESFKQSDDFISSLKSARFELSNFEQLSLEQIKSEYLDLYQRFLKFNSDFDEQKLKLWINQITNLENYILMNTFEGGTLRGAQSDVFEDLYEFIQEGNTRGRIILPTGVGKTILFTEFVKVIQRNTSKQTLIVTEGNTLVKQTGDKIAKFAPNIEFGKLNGQNKDFDSEVIISTYDSFVIGVNNGMIKPNNFQCIILDEAHRSLPKKRQEAVQKFDDLGVLVLEFTATDSYSENKKLVSPVIHEMTILEAVEKKLLCPFSCIIANINIDLSGVEINTTGEYDSAELEKVLRSAGINKACVELYEKGFEGKTAIIFVNTINHAEQLVQMFNSKYGEDFAAGLHGETPDEARVISNLDSGKTKVVIGVDKLITGFDWPPGIVRMRVTPSGSPLKIIQDAGRVLRLDPDNEDKHAFIIDFVYQDRRKSNSQILFPQTLDRDSYIALLAKMESNDNNWNQSTNLNKRKSSIIPDFNIDGIQIIVDQHEVFNISSSLLENRGTGVEKKSNEATLEEIRQLCLKYGIYRATDYADFYYRNSKIKGIIPTSSFSILLREAGINFEEFLDFQLPENAEELLSSVIEFCKLHQIKSKKSYEWASWREKIDVPEYHYLVTMLKKSGYNNFLDFIKEISPKQIKLPKKTFEEVKSICREQKITKAGE